MFCDDGAIFSIIMYEHASEKLARALEDLYEQIRYEKSVQSYRSYDIIACLPACLIKY